MDELIVFLNDHVDTILLDSFLSEISGLPLLAELRRTSHNIDLFNNYNNDSITPEECLSDYLSNYFFCFPIITELILKAKIYDCELIPIGPDGLNVFSDDFVKQADKQMLKNIDEFALDYKSIAGLIIGREHQGLMAGLSCKITYLKAMA